MKFPNKLFEYKESVLSDCIVIMNCEPKDMLIVELYFLCRKKINGIQGFYDALTVLFALGKIEYNKETRRVSSVK